jgi:hypothetical protein
MDSHAEGGFWDSVGVNTEYIQYTLQAQVCRRVEGGEARHRKKQRSRLEALAGGDAD